MLHQVAVVTGAGAGIGRAAAMALGRAGFDLALLGRDASRLAATAGELKQAGARVFTISVDVSDAAAIEAAAETIETEFGPIALWANCAGATVIGQVAELSADEIRRATEVTYLGSVFGTQSALSRMRRRGMGTIINLDLAPTLRGLPLQALESGARAGLRGFCDSLRAEIRHDADRIRVVLLQLPSVNTPRFGWTRNHTGKRLRPPLPVYEPEIAGEAIARAAFGKADTLWIGFSGIVSNVMATCLPGWRDAWMASDGYTAQLEKYAAAEDVPDNLFESVVGAAASHGRFDQEARKMDGLGVLFLSPNMIGGAVAAVTALVAAWVLVRLGGQRRGRS